MSNGITRAIARVRDEMKQLTGKTTGAWRDNDRQVVRLVNDDLAEKLHADRRGMPDIHDAGRRPGTCERAAPSPVDESPPPHLVDRSVPGERYFVQDTASPRFYAEGSIGRHGELSISIRTRLEDGKRSTLLRGEEQFRAVLKFFEGEFTAIKGNWQYGSNLARFNELTAREVPPEVAAGQTWTGKRAADAGFRTARILTSQGDPGKYTSVQAVFTDE